MSHTRLATIAALLGGATALTACGGGSTSSATPTATIVVRPSASASTPATTETAILKAVADWSLAFDRAVREMNPDDPRLPATATGSQLIHDLTTLHSWQIQGITAKGDLPHVIDSHVVSMETTTANVKACVYDPGVLIYKANGQQVPTNAAGQFYVDLQATLQQIDGTWKVSDSSSQSEASGCLPGF